MTKDLLKDISISFVDEEEEEDCEMKEEDQPGNGKSQLDPNDESLPKPKISDNSLVVLERRYLKKNENGEIVESPEELFIRVAHNIANVELNYNPDADVKKIERDFYEMMVNFDFLPNSPTLMNAGRELQQLSACFVLPVEDSMASIFEAIKNTALIHKSGGGTGFSFSRVRPKNDKVLSTKGISSGPISFMSVFDAATETVKQGGTRRGANMGILRIDHPDILDFITCKKDDGKISNFNISVAINENFMKKAETGEDYDLINPRTGLVEKSMNAAKVFNLIVNMAWRNGEPGIIFLDRINKDNPTPNIGMIESTNPCGEQPLLPYESCNLGSLNLTNMVKYDDGKFVVDYDKLRKTVFNSVRFLDNVIDANQYPLPEINRMTKANRKIGLGVMGFADLLIKLSIPYNSDKALEYAENIMNFIQEESKKASVSLAEERGVFPNFKGSKYDIEGGMKLRNATTTTIAPTGTISIIAGASGGIEPLFAVSFFRNVMDNDKLIETHPEFERIAKEEGFYTKSLMQKIAEKGTIRDMEEIPEWVREIFVTAHDISPKDHIIMQAAFQKYTDNAVSKTVNFPNEATPEEIEDVYKLAFQLGCKGVTVYRDGSREEQVLNIDRKKKEQQRIKIIPRERPKVTHGITEKITTSDGTLYITINFDESGLCEVFTNIGKHGSDVAAWSEAVGRLISLALRSGIDPKAVVSQMRGITSRPVWENGEQILSVPDAIGKVLSHYLMNDDKKQLPLVFAESNKAKIQSDEPKIVTRTCPDCGSMIIAESGCVVCKTCGYSDCS